MEIETTRGDAVLPTAGESLPAPSSEQTPLPIAEVEGREQRVRYVNASFCALVQRSREEMIGQPFAGIVGDDPKCIELLRRVYETGQAGMHVAPADAAPACWLYAMWRALDERDQPERVVIQLTKAPMYREDMVALNEALLLGSVQQHELRETAEVSNRSLQKEIAERRRIEAELQAAQVQLQAAATRLEETVEERTQQLRASIGELEAFAYSLAHDLRAPVRAITSFTQFALELPPEEVGPAASPLLKRVLRAATRMDSLIQDVLALTHLSQRPIALVAADLDALVCNLVEERPELAPPRAQIDVARPLLPVVAHEATLSQAVSNLLSNAVKFVAPGATPRVRVRTEAVRGPGAEPYVRLWVEDEGIGIAPADGARIFEIFQRLHNNSVYEGTGIGLAIVRKGIERMGGRVGVECAKGAGSRFWVELPAAPAAVE